MTTVFALSKATAIETQREILGCEGCSRDAELPLCWLLDAMTGRKPATTDYLLAEPLTCPRCGSKITEDTLVEWE
jgi:hypothetical protein